MRGKKTCILLVLGFLSIMTIIRMLTRIDTESTEKVYLKQRKENTKYFELTSFGKSVYSSNYPGNIVTVLTTFVPHVPHGQRSEMDKYRYITQINFLQTTLFTNFKAKIQFIVFTNCSFWTDKIRESYPHVIIQQLILRNLFSTPLLKDMMLIGMSDSNTPFYMFTNSDNLYDTTLLTTINSVLAAISATQLRTKILVIGHRFNRVVRDVIRNEDDILKLMKMAHKSKPFAKDYAIVTKDSFDWSIFPDMVVGRQFFDSYLVDYAFHNEIQVLDATATIRLVHQEFKRGYSTAMNADKYDNDWNKNIFGEKISHSSIHCANYKTEYDQERILILDREKNKYLQNINEYNFAEEYRRELDKIQRCEKHGNTTGAKSVSLTIIILTNNKPESLLRLLQVLNKSAYNNKHIDLIISINEGQTGFYDLETLKIASEFEWTQGHKCSYLTTHKDELSRSIEVTDYISVTPFLLLQDDIILSTHFHTALSGAVSTYEATQEWQRGDISGISLEPPITPPYSLKTYHKLVAQFSEGMVLSRPLNSRAFYPNLMVWRQFTDWVKRVKSGVTKFRVSDLANSFAASKLNNGNITEWYNGMFGVWFCHFIEVRSGTIGYFLNPKGAIGTWGYRGLDGSEKFLSYTCDLKNVYVKIGIPILSVKNPNFRFPLSPPRIEI